MYLIPKSLTNSCWVIPLALGLALGLVEVIPVVTWLATGSEPLTTPTGPLEVCSSNPRPGLEALISPTGPLKVWPSNPGKLGLKPLISPTGPLNCCPSNCLFA